MLYWLMPDELARVFVAKRSFGALVTAFLIAVVLGRPVIAWLLRRGIGEHTEKTPIEDEKLRSQISLKSGTPTMGGVIILAAMLAGCVLWGNLTDFWMWLSIGCFLALAALGMVDDWKKLRDAAHRDRGLKVGYKLLAQGLVGAALAAIVLARHVPDVHKQFALEGLLPLGGLAVLWSALVIATMSNAVNVTDGLDGLAGGLALVSLFALGLLSSSLYERSELCVFAGALFGAVMGFLWHNWHPARVFMGNTGALALGGSIGLLALLTASELLLPLIAFVFLAEFASSVLQVLWFKATGRRILPIAPVHHIFQKMGWPETHIVARFCCVALIVTLGAFELLVW